MSMVNARFRRLPALKSWSVLWTGRCIRPQCSMREIYFVHSYSEKMTLWKNLLFLARRFIAGDVHHIRLTARADSLNTCIKHFVTWSIQSVLQPYLLSKNSTTIYKVIQLGEHRYGDRSKLTRFVSSTRLSSKALIERGRQYWTEPKRITMYCNMWPQKCWMHCTACWKVIRSTFRKGVLEHWPEVTQLNIE